MSSCDLDTGFAGNPLDRLSQAREDSRLLAELAAAPDDRWRLITAVR